MYPGTHTELGVLQSTVSINGFIYIASLDLLRNSKWFKVVITVLLRIKLSLYPNLSWMYLTSYVLSTLFTHVAGEGKNVHVAKQNVLTLLPEHPTWWQSEYLHNFSSFQDLFFVIMILTLSSMLLI